MAKSKPSIRSRSTTNELFSATTWLIQEARACADGEPARDLEMLTKGWPEATVDGQRIALRIAERHEPRLFDPGVFLFMRLAIAFAGSITLNAVGGGRKRLLYPRIVPYAGKDAGHQSKKPPISVDRITVDAAPGRAVKEGENHRDRTASNLRVSSDATETTGKFARGREEAMPEIMAAYDYRSSKTKKMPIDRETYERLLRAALELHDVRRSESEM